LFELGGNLPHQHPCGFHLGRDALSADIVDSFIQSPSSICQPLTRFITRLRKLDASIRVELRHSSLVLSARLSSQVPIMLRLAAQLFDRPQLALQTISGF
jgi:hypothetical protein